VTRPRGVLLRSMLAVGTAASSSMVFATDIHRCIVDGKPTFQQTRCTEQARRPGAASSPAMTAFESPDERKRRIADAEARRAEEARRRKELQQGFREAPESPQSARPDIGYQPLPRIHKESMDVLVNRMTSMVVILGRGVACGAPGTDEAFRRFGAWMDRERMPIELTAIAAQGIKYHALQQANGSSPDSCETVRKQFPMTPWPW
jgi:hypothetical protein